MKTGDKVRVKDPDNFTHEESARLKDRTGIVEKTGGDTVGAFMSGRVWVRFLKRNGRGKEFRRWMREEWLENEKASQNEVAVVPNVQGAQDARHQPVEPEGL